MGGVVGGEKINAKVVYSKGEGGGKGRMGTNVRSIFHRGVSMGLEVAYKVFVGNASGFLEPIHPLSDINVYVAARVRDGEEGVFNDHLVGNGISLIRIRMYLKLDIRLLRYLFMMSAVM